MICCWFYVLLDFFLRITKKVSTQPTPTLILTPTLAQAQARSERDFAARCGSSEKEMRVPSQKRKQFCTLSRTFRAARSQQPRLRALDGQTQDTHPTIYLLLRLEETKSRARRGGLNVSTCERALSQIRRYESHVRVSGIRYQTY